MHFSPKMKKVTTLDLTNLMKNFLHHRQSRYSYRMVLMHYFTNLCCPSVLVEFIFLQGKVVMLWVVDVLSTLHYIGNLVKHDIVFRTNAWTNKLDYLTASLVQTSNTSRYLWSLFEHQSFQQNYNIFSYASTWNNFNHTMEYCCNWAISLILQYLIYF